jgi:hypothetical protein
MNHGARAENRSMCDLEVEMDSAEAGELESPI